MLFCLLLLFCGGAVGNGGGGGGGGGGGQTAHLWWLVGHGGLVGAGGWRWWLALVASGIIGIGRLNRSWFAMFLSVYSCGFFLLYSFFFLL